MKIVIQENVSMEWQPGSPMFPNITQVPRVVGEEQLKWSLLIRFEACC